MMMEPGQSKNSVEEVELEEIAGDNSTNTSGEDTEPELEQTRL